MITEPTKAERKSKQFWASVDGRVVHVTGYECPPNDKLWWCPKVGYSMNEGFHLFKTKEQAVAKARKELVESLNGIKDALKALDDL